MKRNILKAGVLGIALMFTTNVNAQFDLKGLAGKVLGGSASSSSSSSESLSGSDLISTLTSVFSKDKQANQNNIVGTWNYSEPAIVLSSDNIITKTAAKVAANKVEKKLQTYLTQYGITPGTFSLTFKADGTCTETIKGKTVSGKWSIVDSKLQLNIKGVKVPITTQISGSDMQLVTDATKLLNMFKSFGASSSNSNLQTITTLLKGVNGMQAGITLKKQ